MSGRADPPFEPHPARTATIPPAVRAELDQTPAWWEQQYTALIAATFTAAPFDPTEHDGHDVIERRTYTDPAPTLVCTECPTRLIPIRKT